MPLAVPEDLWPESAPSRRVLSEAEILLGQIQQLYAQLRSLPVGEKPDASRHKVGSHKAYGSLAYTALERQIKIRADQYRALTAEEVVT